MCCVLKWEHVEGRDYDGRYEYEEAQMGDIGWLTVEESLRGGKWCASITYTGYLSLSTRLFYGFECSSVVDACREAEVRALRWFEEQIAVYSAAVDVLKDPEVVPAEPAEEL